MRFFRNKRDIDSTAVTSETSWVSVVDALLLPHSLSLETCDVGVYVPTVATPVHLVVAFWRAKVDELLANVTSGFVSPQVFVEYLWELELETLVFRVFAHLLSPPS